MIKIIVGEISRKEKKKKTRKSSHYRSSTRWSASESARERERGEAVFDHLSVFSTHAYRADLPWWCLCRKQNFLGFFFFASSHHQNCSFCTVFSLRVLVSERNTLREKIRVCDFTSFSLCYRWLICRFLLRSF